MSFYNNNEKLQITQLSVTDYVNQEVANRKLHTVKIICCYNLNVLIYRCHSCLFNLVL